MPNTIIHKRSSTGSNVPTAGEVEQGELAINTADERVWSKNSSNVIWEITDHDNLTNYVANEHIDWTSATQSLSTSGNISGANLNASNGLDVTGGHLILSNTVDARWEGGLHRITNNDGGGNWNIRHNNYYSSGDKHSATGMSTHLEFSDSTNNATANLEINCSTSGSADTALSTNGKFYFYNASATNPGFDINDGSLLLNNTVRISNAGAGTLASLTLTTALDETDGGTGTDTYAAGDILYASAANTLAKLAAGTNGHVLTLSGGLPVWQAGGAGGDPDQNLFETLTVTDTDSGYTWTDTGSIVADTTTDTATFVSGTDIDIDVDAGSDAIRVAFSNATGYTTNTGTVTAVNNGNGMNFTNITSSGTVTLGTPSSITDTSTNSVTASSHTHAVSHTGSGNFVMATSPTISALTMTGNNIVSGNYLRLNDNVELFFGTSNDLGMRFNSGGGNAEFFSNVGSFNITMTDLDINMADNIIIRAEMDDYCLSNTSVTPTGTTQTCTYSTSQSYEVDLGSTTGNITITLSGGPPTGKYGEMIIKVTQHNTINRTITWAGGTFEWPGGTAPTMSTGADAIDIYHFSTWNAGSNWFGSVIQDCK